MSNLISISTEDIPDWLQDSSLCQDIIDKNKNFISIPKNKLENEIKINNIDDLYKYLEILIYWKIINCPYEIYDYIKLNKNIINFSYIKEKFHDLPFLDEFKILCSTINKKKTKYFICREASKKGYFNLLKYAHKNGYPWNEWTCTNAAKHGHFECLKYAHENGCLWTKDTCDYAVLNGHLECLKYLINKKCPGYEEICKYAALNGYLNLLKFAYENDCPWHKHTCSSAAENGHLDCLKFVHENGCPLDEDTCFYAGKNGYLLESLNIHDNNRYLECLKYAIDKKCPGYEKYTSDYFAKHLDYLKNAHEKCCHWDEYTYSNAAEN